MTGRGLSRDRTGRANGHVADRTGAANGHVTEPHAHLPNIEEPRAGRSGQRPTKTPGYKVDAKPPAHGMWGHSLSICECSSTSCAGQRSCARLSAPRAPDETRSAAPGRRRRRTRGSVIGGGFYTQYGLVYRFTRRFLRASSSEVPIRANSSLSYFRVIHATDAKPPHRGRYGEEDGGCGNGKRLPPATRHRRASRALAALARPRGTRGLPAATRAHAPHRSRGVAK